mmetsp:Transcript_6418/g.14952  ORF Transcript_6418/g.14952 Transcript_6418/m.14952 type:complete len:341 (-) Transcript_6418:35-1057(-)
MLAGSSSPESSIMARRQRAKGGMNRPVLVLSPQACEAESCTTEGVLAKPFEFGLGHAPSDQEGAVAASQPGRELLPPPPVSPRARKMARQNMEIGRDLLQSGVSEEAGSWGWFLQRRGGSSTPKRRKSNDGLSFSFMSKFGTLRVDDQSSQPPDPASFRNQWKTSHSFSDSASSAVSSFSGSFGSHTTVTTISHEPSLDGSRAVSPLGVVAPEQSRAALCSSVRRRRSWISGSFSSNTGSSHSLTGKRQRSPGGMQLDEDAACAPFNPLAPGWGLFGGEPVPSVTSSVQAGGADAEHGEEGARGGTRCAEEHEGDVVAPLLVLPPKGGRRSLKDHKAYSL